MVIGRARRLVIADEHRNCQHDHANELICMSVASGAEWLPASRISFAFLLFRHLNSGRSCVTHNRRVKVLVVRFYWETDFGFTDGAFATITLGLGGG